MRDLLILFLRLGTTAVGGPAAHIALMHREVVERRGWLTREAFLDLLAVSNLLPGPTSTELALHIGHRRHGLAGLVAAGVAFILPAALITLALAMLYVAAGRVPAVQHVLGGLKPAVLAIVLVALVRLAPGTLTTWRLRLASALSLGLALGGLHELAVLAAGGAMAWLLSRPRSGSTAPALTGWPLLAWSSAGTIAAGATAAPTVAGLFGLFLKVGAVLFGSGYVLLAFLRAELVVRRPWLTDAQLLDAIAIGQVTPGPVFTTATFVGYLLAGVPGAVASTLGIFLPAFFFVALSGPLMDWLRRAPGRRAALDGLVAASLALMGAVVVELARSALGSGAAVGIAAATLAILLATRLNAAVPLIAAGLVGWWLGLT